jgi:hypothetical protein
MYDDINDGVFVRSTNPFQAQKTFELFKLCRQTVLGLGGAQNWGVVINYQGYSDFCSNFYVSKSEYPS